MYGLLGARLRRWLEGERRGGKGEPAAETGRPTPRGANPALPGGESGDGQGCTSAPKTDGVAIDCTQKARNGEETPSGAQPASEVEPITKCC